LDGFIEQHYRPFLETAIAWHYLTASLFLGLIVFRRGSGG
jgi:hypothetical protein